MTTLYSLRTDGDQHRITKFVDGEVESSYLTTFRECECPAGHRASCRHRQMLPQMLAAGIVNTHWFYNFDTHRVVDFNGELKSNIDALNALGDRTLKVGASEVEPLLSSDELAEEVDLSDSMPVQQIPPGDYTAEVDKIKTHPDGQVMMSFKNVKPWRRL